jgi:hypothetical protein
MHQNLFPQNVIALVWDFDKTLIPNYMQEPFFEHFNVDARIFWDEVNALPDFHRQKNGLSLISKDSLYLNHILTYVRQGIFAGLNNNMLRQLGAKITLCPGLPNFLEEIKTIVETDARALRYGLKLEHYIVSSGLRQIIVGSPVSNFVDGVWGCEFIENIPLPGYLSADHDTVQMSDVISEVAYVIDNTSKTRALFELNKGTNKVPEVSVNAKIAAEDRRIPFSQMVYIADGAGDIPAFSIVKGQGGRAFAVYQPDSRKEFVQTNALQKQQRIDAFGPADYRPSSHTYKWLLNAIEEIVSEIIEQREQSLRQRLGRPPEHIYLE